MNKERETMMGEHNNKLNEAEKKVEQLTRETRDLNQHLTEVKQDANNQ